jgi:hypothetical protein
VLDMDLQTLTIFATDVYLLGILIINLAY